MLIVIALAVVKIVLNKTLPNSSDTAFCLKIQYTVFQILVPNINTKEHFIAKL